ncbi:MAG: LacI family DNA-binding transcriptional regulator [Chloroflexota bacterium]
MKRRPTIIDVAREAGVSKSTVSRVIADDGLGVNQETKERVLQAVENLGYVRNAVASSMRTDRTNLIMLAIPDITNPYWPEVARGVQDVMDAEGYAVVFANSDWDEERETEYLKMARRNRLDGILINTVRVSSDRLKATGIPTVVLGTREEYSDFDRVGADSYVGTKFAVQHLVDMGHRRIGVILGQLDTKSKDSRKRGYVDVLVNAGISVDESLITIVPFTRAGGETGFKSLLELTPPPSAIFCANDTIAIGALQTALAAGLDVPGDISIIGLDDIDAAMTTHPPLTTITKPKYDIGRQAANFLLEQIHGDAPAMPRKLQLAGELCVRGTTAPPSNK